VSYISASQSLKARPRLGLRYGSFESLDVAAHPLQSKLDLASWFPDSAYFPTFTNCGISLVNSASDAVLAGRPSTINEAR
jgi:hypothetical protein